jgi:hypothetical protein
MEERRKNMWYMHAVEYHLTLRRKNILSFETIWMDLEGIVLNETNQTQKDKY